MYVYVYIHIYIYTYILDESDSTIVVRPNRPSATSMSRASPLPSHRRISPKPRWICVLGVMDAGIWCIPAGIAMEHHFSDANQHSRLSTGTFSMAMLNKQEVMCKPLYSSGASHVQLRYILMVIPTDKWLRPKCYIPFSCGFVSCGWSNIAG